MAVNLKVPNAADLCSVPGVRLGVTEAGIRKAGRKDLAVVLLDAGSQVAGVFTQNRFCAAPVQVCREHLMSPAAQGALPPGGASAALGRPGGGRDSDGIRALLINTGNANAGTGAQGLADARRCCAALAARLGLKPGQVLPFSTGVIMEPLPVERIEAGLAAAIAHAAGGPEHWLLAAQAIMTTDTVPKAVSRQITLEGKPVRITGISKGAGMIHPGMATMLGFLATDAAIAPALLQPLARQLADASFNRITVDGDTSTNDSFIVIATGQAGHAPITALDSPEGRQLVEAMTGVAHLLAQAIIRDGEGATKFITVQIEGGRDAAECRKVAYAIAHSPLVKTAFFASDPNLGRILAAAGYAGIADLDQNQIDLWLGDVHVVSQGGRLPAYREEDGQRVMKQSEITIRVGLGRGSAVDTVWTCDLSHDYVSINADYRS